MSMRDFCITLSTAFSTSFAIMRFESPGVRFWLNILWRRGRRMSASIRSTFFPPAQWKRPDWEAGRS